MMPRANIVEWTYHHGNNDWHAIEPVEPLFGGNDFTIPTSNSQYQNSALEVRAIDLPSVSQLDGSVNASDDDEKGGNSQTNEHQDNTPRNDGPSGVLLLDLGGTSRSVERVSDDKLDSEDRKQNDSDYM